MFEENDILFLVDKPYVPLMRDYLQYLSLGEAHFSTPRLSEAAAEEKLRLWEKIIRRDISEQTNLLARLQRQFLKENLSLYLLLDVLQGWRYLAGNRCPKTESRLSELCGYLTSPLARLIMVLQGQGPSTYLPMTSLLVCLYQLDLFAHDGKLQKKIKISRKNKINKLKGLLKNAKVILEIVDSKKMKFRLAWLLNELQIKVGQFEKNKQIKIGILDCLRIFLYSSIQFFIIKKRTVEKKGI